jgi:hypothetical protein
MKSNIWASTKDTYSACCCVGRQDGEPFCPCEMKARGIHKKSGRWIEPPSGETDHGPVKLGSQ